MSPYFEEAFSFVLDLEETFGNHGSAADERTPYGITEETARRYGYEGDVHDLPEDVAREIYHARFWKPLRLDDVAEVDEALARELFEAAVHTGIIRPVLWLQRVLNVLNRPDSLYEEVDEDGVLGSQTLGALRAFARFRAPDVLTKAINCLQGSFYIELAERKERSEAFVYGWLNRRIRL